MDFRLRRAKRSDLGAILALLERNGLPLPPEDRAALRRFRNVVADLAADFDVAATRNGVCGFVHLAYARDLRVGNRATLLALVADTPEVGRALFDAALRRARRRRCHDLTVTPGPWIAEPATGELPADGRETAETLQIDLSSQRVAE